MNNIFYNIKSKISNKAIKQYKLINPIKKTPNSLIDLKNYLIKTTQKLFSNIQFHLLNRPVDSAPINPHINLNLTQWRQYHNQKTLIKIGVISGVLILIFFVIILMWRHIVINKQKFQQNINQAISLKLKPLQNPPSILTIQNNNINSNQINLVNIFNTLSNKTPHNIYLEKLILNNNEISILGHAKTLKNIQEYKNNLSNSKGYTNITTHKIKHDGGSPEFVVSLEVTG